MFLKQHFFIAFVRLSLTADGWNIFLSAWNLERVRNQMKEKNEISSGSEEEENIQNKTKNDDVLD